jgi:hypothetical protein
VEFTTSGQLLEADPDEGTKSFKSSAFASMHSRCFQKLAIQDVKINVVLNVVTAARIVKEEVV